MGENRLTRPSIQKRYHVTTFGCQMNQHDSERLKGMLESLGYGEAHTRDQADLILFNTCSIREKADNRFLSYLGEAKHLKTARPDRVIGVGGCWAQSVKEEIFARFPFVDVAFGPGQMHKLAEFLTSDSLRAKRRYAIVICFIVAAVLAPPDVISQLALAAPLIAFYEISIIIGSWIEKKRAEEEKKADVEAEAEQTKT